jgi:ATP-dependent helicase/nuclease subunit B
VLRDKLSGFFQRRITTFDRALRELLKLGGFDFASDVTRRIILNQILSNMSLHYFEHAAHMNGFLELIGRMIVEFKEQLIRPEELKKKLEELKKLFPEFELKYDDLSEIYEAYDEELKKRNLIDQRDSLRLLEEGLNRGEFSDPELKRVWIDGFSDFSKLQLAFIEFLTRHADEVTVTLTLDQNPYRESLFEIVSETQTALLDMGFRIQWLSEKNYRSANVPLAHLERHLFSHKPVIARSPANSGTTKQSVSSPKSLVGGPDLRFPPKDCGNDKKDVPRNDDHIQIFEATGLQGELEMIAREIKRVVRTHQYHFSDIAVLFRSTDPYLSVIQSVFRQFEIPYELHERFRLRLNPLARTLMSFLGILLNDWKREDLFNFLKSSYVTQSGTGSARTGTVGLVDEISILELQALEKGIYRDRAYWLESFPESKPLHDIARFEDQFLKIKTADQFSEWVKGVLNYFGLFKFHDDSDSKSRIDREALRRILLLLEELKQKHTHPSNDEACALAREFLTLIEVDLFSVHSRDINRVQIYNVSVARQKEYKAVFLAGLLEKQFPIQMKEDPILSDSERRALNEKGEVLKERLPRQAFERYLFYLAATRAQERLILSFPRFDLEGKEALPSFYVDEVRNLFANELAIKRQPITEILPPLGEMANVEEAEALVIQELWSVPDRKNDRNSSVLFAIYDFLNQKPDFPPLVRRLLESIEGVLEDAKIAAHFLPRQGMWSPTYLEEYAECSYRFFAHRGLNLESQAEGIDIRRRGIILHDVLEAFFTWQRDRNKSGPPAGGAGKQTSFDEAQDFCLNKFKELWTEEPLRGDRYYKIELERKNMQEMILQILRAELIEKKPPIPGLIPAYFEFEFKDLVLKGNKEEIRLRGKIDRIDVDPTGTYALVIDYKTGKQFEMRFLENGVFLQLPFYLTAIREKLGLKPLGGHLYSLYEARSKGFHHQEYLDEAQVTTRKGNRFSGKDFESILRRSVLFAERFVEEIEEAKIPVRPRDCVPYCPYASVCRIEKWRLDHIYQEIEEEDRKWLAKQTAPPFN